MSDSMKEFLDAEIREIVGTMDEISLCDPELLQQRTLEWIEKNAEHFRNHWDRKNMAQGS